MTHTAQRRCQHTLRTAQAQADAREQQQRRSKTCRGANRERGEEEAGEAGLGRVGVGREDGGREQAGEGLGEGEDLEREGGGDGADGEEEDEPARSDRPERDRLVRSDAAGVVDPVEGDDGVGLGAEVVAAAEAQGGVEDERVDERRREDELRVALVLGHVDDHRHSLVAHLPPPPRKLRARDRAPHRTAPHRTAPHADAQDVRARACKRRRQRWEWSMPGRRGRW
eukprot:3386373-Rhodomonas_salina.1